MLCPVGKTAERLPEEPNEPELNSIRNDPQKLAAIRSRLSDIGWWMRLLCQQGQRPLSCFAAENFEEEVIAPSATSSLHGDALLAGVLFEE